MTSIKPGNFDSLHTSTLFPSGLPYNIPEIAPASMVSIPAHIYPYGVRFRYRTITTDDVGIHFWIDDHRFEMAWNRPRKVVNALSRFKIVFTPDFSIYANWPKALNLWQIYRRAWISRLWSELSLTVIPTLSFGHPDTYDWCFLGLPQQSVLGLSTIGIDLTNPTIYRHFEQGYLEAIDRLQPLALLINGTLPTPLHAYCPIIEYPSQSGWTKLRTRRETKSWNFSDE